MNRTKNVEGLREYHKQRNLETHEKVLKVIENLKRSKGKITVKAVAEKAGVSVATIYNNKSLIERITQIKEIKNGLTNEEAKKSKRDMKIDELRELLKQTREELGEEKRKNALLLGHLEKAVSKKMELEARINEYRNTIEFKRHKNSN